MVEVEIERSGVAKVSESFGLDSYSNMAYAGPSCWLVSQEVTMLYCELVVSQRRYSAHLSFKN